MNIEEQNQRECWDALTGILEQKFLTKNQAYWAELFAGSDACVAPVLDLEDLQSHAHHRARQSYELRDGVIHAAVAPRFSRTKGAIGETRDGDELIAAWTATPSSTAPIKNRSSGFAP